MGSFLEELWENIWSGFTPIIMTGLLFLGFNMARKFSSLGVSPFTTFLAYALGLTIVPLSLPVFLIYKKR